MTQRLTMGKPPRGVRPPEAAAQDFQGDLQCAVTSAVPVLITGPSDVADQIAHHIHRAGRSTKPFVMVDAATASDSVRLAFESAAPEGVLVLRNVDRLAATEQPSLRDHLDQPGVRVIATTAVNLFALVERGGFDERLFYRLNQIHLVPPVE